jgi:kumamolisin
VLGLAFVLLVATRLTGQTADATRVVFDNSIRAVPEESATSTSLVATAVTRRTAVITRRELKAEELAAPMDFAVSLTMRNYAELEARIGRGEVISPAEMAAKYDPAVEDYNKVADWIQSQGMTITHESTHHLAVFAEGTVSQVKAAFAVDFARVTGVDGVEYSSAITAPSVPAEVASGILGINGLQPHIRMHRNMVRPQATSSLPVDGYLTAAVVQAYNANASGLTGAGQTIAIVIDTEPSEKDVTTFWKDCGVKQSWNNITFIKVNKGELSPPEGEETLDVEWSSSMAPAAKIRLYATVDLFPLDIDLGYEQILKDLPSQPGLNQVSLSFGDTESDSGVSQMETDDEYFAELASAGVTVFAATGDGGSRPDFTEFGSIYNKHSPVQVENPASDPNVTAVGGTNLQLTSGNSVISETAWSVEGNGESGATGGGASQLFARPTWQVGEGVPSGNPAAAQLGSSPPMRLLPDVAAIADPATPGFLYLDGEGTEAAGTSLATPVWAGFCALINQARAKQGLGPLGLLGPRIYPIVGAAAFRDITKGNNGDYSAGVGYDMCTGLGAPNVENLVGALVSEPTVSVPPSNQTVYVGQNATFTVTANATGSLSYQWQREAAGGSTWSNLSDGGTYAGTNTATLTVNGVTVGMSGDQFQCVITNSFGSFTTSNAATLVVSVPLVFTTFSGLTGNAGSTDSTGGSPQFNAPNGVAVDLGGNIYVADAGNDVIRKITPGGVVTTLAGQAGIPGSTDNTGSLARFNNPMAVTVDSNGNVYVADTGNDEIRKITPEGVVTTLAGLAGITGNTIGVGSSARFNGPAGIVSDSAGNLFVSDTNNHTVRRVTANGNVSGNWTVGGVGGSAEFGSPEGFDM